MDSILPDPISSMLSVGVGGPRLPTRTNRALARVEEKALVRSAEVQAIAYVGQTALNATAQVTMAEVSLAAVVPEGARLRLAAIADTTTAAIQARILDLMNGI